MFDKKEFAKVLYKAKGIKSINQYAKESGVSAAYISKLLRGMYSTAPSPTILKKLADHSNTVSYGELMAAAGHIIPLEENEKISAKMAYLIRDNEIYRAWNPDVDNSYDILTEEEKKELDDFKKTASPQELLLFIRELGELRLKSIEQLTLGDREAKSLDQKSSEENDSFEYNYYPTSISAGLPSGVDAIKNGECEKISIANHIMGKWAKHKDVFFTKINGDSMNRVIPDGSIIAIKPIEKEQIKNGDIVVYRHGGEYAVKRFEKYPDKIVFRPDSYDHSFTDHVIDLNNPKYDSDDVKIKGKVILWIVVSD